MNRLMERVAGAPITWGVCEVPGWGYQFDRERVLGEMRSIGLRATELGPDGFLPTQPGRLRALLASHDLKLAAGFIPLVLHRSELLEDQLSQAARKADLLAALGGDVLVIAAALGEDGYEVSAALDSSEWRTLAGGIDRVADLAGARDLQIALHPHFGTIIEGPHDVERLLDFSPVPLCIDTGHLLVGGSDPVEVTRAARGRIAHVHLKDVSADIAERVRARVDIGYHAAVRDGMYRPLGDGDVDVAEIVRLLESSDYGGWYVLEQDAVLDVIAKEGDGPVQDAAKSLEFLRRVAGKIETGISA